VDITTRDDCERLVRAFYSRAMTDPILGFIFVDVAKLDLEAHVPKITDFWETVLLGVQSYHGGAFRVHAELNAKVPLRAGHFERWLHIWRTTVDELLVGRTASLAKSHADRVGRAFFQRIEAINGPPGGPGPFVVSQHGG
jgi:hemoglobin